MTTLAIFKVKFLGEYHDFVIDWSDESHEYKQVQLFKQVITIDKSILSVFYFKFGLVFY